MFKNYFTLNRHVVEVNALLSGYTLSSVFTQEKDKLILCFINNPDELFVEINTDQSFPYFIIREKFSRAKKNTLDFFHDFLPSKLESIQIAEYDRIIKFNIKNACIYFFIRGKETNVFLIDELSNIFPFKKMNDEKSIADEIVQLKFTDAFLSTAITFDKSDEDSPLHSRKYPYLGKEILSLFDKRSKNNPEISKQILMNQILQEIKTNNPFLYKDKLLGKLNLSFFPDDTESNLEIVSFERINDALKYFISEKQKDYKQIEAKKSPVENLEKKLVHLEKKQQHLSNRILAGCKDQEYQRIGNLLLLNLWKIKTGDKKIELEDIYQSNQLIVIDLNPKYNPKENADSYFQKAKSERKDYDESKRLINDVDKEINKLKKQLSEFNSTNPEKFSSDSISSIGTKNRLTQTAPQNSRSKFRQFILHEKYLIFVGKNSKNNDELTTSYAKQNDYWFHARSVSGSHVVLRWDKSLGEIQKSILEKAASVAAFYSKAKTSGLVPVSYAQKKYVIKRKGMEPGKVALLREKVLIVKPEIPKECKIITD